MNNISFNYKFQSSFGDRKEIPIVKNSRPHKVMLPVYVSYGIGYNF